MNFNFINTINLYWLQLYSIFVFYSKMLINQSVISFFFIFSTRWKQCNKNV